MLENSWNDLVATTFGRISGVIKMKTVGSFGIIVVDKVSAKIIVLCMN